MDLKNTGLFLYSTEIFCIAAVGWIRIGLFYWKCDFVGVNVLSNEYQDTLYSLTDYNS